MPDSNANDTIQTSRAALIRRLRLAEEAPRCMHIRTNGVRCGSPALRGQGYCYFHNLASNSAYDRVLPPLEDANAVQFAIMKVLNCVMQGSIERDQAKSLLYGLQTAALNVRRVNFNPPAEAVVVADPIDDELDQLQAEQEAARKRPQRAAEAHESQLMPIHTAMGERGASAGLRESSARDDAAEPSAKARGTSVAAALEDND